MAYLSPFNSLFGSNVYVVSDSTLKNMMKEQHQQELDVLQSRLASYEQAADSLRSEIAKVSDEIALLEPEAPKNE